MSRKRIGGEVERQFDTENWKRKVQAEDLSNVRAFLCKGILSTEGIEHFDTWKEDIVWAKEAVLLTGGGRLRNGI